MHNEIEIIIENHKATPNLDALVSSLSDGKYMVEMYRSDNKSVNQMRLYRGILLRAFSDYTGYSLDECNGILKTKFLPIETMDIEGVEYKILPSLSKINKVKFSKFIDDVSEYLVDLGLTIPNRELVSE